MMLLTQVDGIMLLEVVLQVLVILVRIVPQFLQCHQLQLAIWTLILLIIVHGGESLVG